MNKQKINKYRAWDRKEKEMIKDALLIGNIGLGEGSVVIDERVQRGNELDWMKYINLDDKNGNPIFKGDVLFDKINGQKYIIQWQETEARFIAKVVNAYGIRHIPDVKIMEIIGNKFENPELIK